MERFRVSTGSKLMQPTCAPFSSGLKLFLLAVSDVPWRLGAAVPNCQTGYAPSNTITAELNKEQL